MVSIAPFSARVDRASRRRPHRYLMCRPTHFGVTYRINPWMHPGEPVSAALAVEQWERLVAVYGSLGHEVELVEPVPGQPDMVFTANAGFVVDDRVVTARFRYPERRGEEPAFRAWFDDAGFESVDTTAAVNEGEGDVLLVGDRVLAATGFRTDPAAIGELAELLERPVLPVELVDPRWYHLDTALGVLDDDLIAWYPPAFAHHSQARIRRLFPDAIIATEADALAFGLNLVSDGHNVVLSAQATDLIAQLDAIGFDPIPVDVSELRKAGGAVKCCTLELRS